MIPVRRFVINRNEGSYIVDVWNNVNGYHAQAQQLYVDDYRSHFVKGCSTETIAAHSAVDLVIAIYK